MGFFNRKEKNNRGYGEIYDTAKMSIDTTATVFWTALGKNPNTSIIYHVKNKAVLDRFLNNPMIGGGGLNINVINLENISGNPFKNGINIFDTSMLHILIKEGKFSYLKNTTLYSDDFNIAKEATGWNLNDEIDIENYRVHNSKE